MSSDPSPRWKLWLETACSETAKKPGGPAAFLVTLLVTADLALLILLLNRYLSVFGQPGLTGFGDVAPLLPTLAPLLAFAFFGILGLIALYVGSPMLVRYIFSGSPGHPLAAAYAWPQDKTSSRRPAAAAYLAAHGPMLTAAAYLVTQGFLPDRVPYSFGLFACAFFAGLVFPLGLVMFKAIRRPGPLWKTLGVTASFSVLLSCLNGIWLVMVLSLTGVLNIDPTATPWAWRAVAAGVVVFFVVMFHWMMTVLSNHRWGTAFAFVVIVLAAVTWVPGDRLITFNALRFAGVGGGVVNFYRNPKSADPETLKAACLILTTGDLRIVRLVKDADLCSGPAMRRQFQGLQTGSPSARQAKLGEVRVLKSELFIDRLPAETAGAVP